MHLFALVTLAAVAAGAPEPEPGRSELSAGGSPRAARLLAEAPRQPLALPGTGVDAQSSHRLQQLLHERRMLRSQLHSNSAFAGLVAAGAAACAVGAFWGVYAAVSVPVLGYFRFSDLGALIGGGASILSGVVMIVLGVVIKKGVDRYNAPVNERLQVVDHELERLTPPEGEEEAPPYRPPPPPPLPVSPL